MCGALVSPTGAPRARPSQGLRPLFGAESSILRCTAAQRGIASLMPPSTVSTAPVV